MELRKLTSEISGLKSQSFQLLTQFHIKFLRDGVGASPTPVAFGDTCVLYHLPRIV